MKSVGTSELQWKSDAQAGLLGSDLRLRQSRIQADPVRANLGHNFPQSGLGPRVAAQVPAKVGVEGLVEVLERGMASQRGLIKVPQTPAAKEVINWNFGEALAHLARSRDI